MDLPNNIGVLIDKIKPGGPTKMAFKEVKWLQRFGYNAKLVVMTEEHTRDYRYNDLTRNIPLEFLSREFPRFFRRSFRLPYFSFFSSCHLFGPIFAPELITKEETSLLIAHETYTCFTALEVHRRKGIPYIAYIHDPITYILPKVYGREGSLKHVLPLLYLAGSYLDRLIVENSVATLTNSVATLERVKKVVNKEEVVVAYPGCNPINNLPEKRGDYLLALTKWDLGKKPHMLLDILERINCEVKLVVAGFWVQEEIKKDFIQEVKRRKLSNQVEILGPLPENMIKELYLGARMLIHPIVEGFGMIGLEAAAYGCPFIIPKGAGVTELFRNRINGLFPEEGNIDEYIKYVDKLVSDERLAWKLGYEAWKIAKQYTWEAHTKTLKEVIIRYLT